MKAPIVESERWLTEKDVSVITGLSLSTLQKNRFYSKGIPYAKIGRAVRYSSADVAHFMNSMKVQISHYNNTTDKENFS